MNYIFGTLAMIDDNSLADQRFVNYIKVSLRRYAARWRQSLRHRADRETLALNEPVVAEDGSQAEAIDLLGTDSCSTEEQYLAMAPIEELISNQVLY